MTFEAELTRRGFLGLMGTTGIALAGCTAGLQGSSSSSTRTLKIGYVSPRTGSLASFADTDDYVLSKVRKVLAKGLTINGTQYAVQILTKDSQSQADRAGQVATELITQDNVDIIVSTATPDTVNPVSDQAEAAGVPSIGTIVPWQSWFNARGGTPAKPFKYTFLYFLGLEDEVVIQPAAWKTVSTDSRVGGLWPNDADGDAFRQAFSAALPKAGFTVVDGGPYQDGAQDYTAIIDKFRGGQVDIIQTVPIPPDWATFWKQANQVGWKPKIAFVSKALLFPSAVEALGALGENLMTDAWWTPTVPYTSSLDGTTAKTFADQYQSSTGRQWSQAMAFNYSAFEIAINALKTAADPKDRNAVAQAIQKSKGRTISGPFDFTSGPVKNVALARVFAAQWQKSTSGKFQYDLVIVENTLDPSVKVTGAIKPLP